ncbi:hypothetical protein PV325_010386 [Microctonus aethiopoides]|nr:hypothetical protein PV325_010386 [Microctonus aethiopoides]
MYKTSAYLMHLLDNALSRNSSAHVSVCAVHATLATLRITQLAESRQKFLHTDFTLQISQKTMRILDIIIMGATSGGFLVAAPVVLPVIGFTSGGIAAGGFGAWMMSTLGGGATAAGGIVATCQSIAATGSVLGSPVATLITGAAGAAIGRVISRIIR